MDAINPIMVSNMHADALLTVDGLLRSGASCLLALIAAVLLRDHGRRLAAQLGALFAIGAIANAICSSPDFHVRTGDAAIPLFSLAVANMAVFWVLARALFQDGFRVRPWHGALWVACLGVGAAQGSGLAPEIVAPVMAAVFTALAVAQTLTSWRGDLVEGRRRTRLLIVILSAALTTLNLSIHILGVRASTPLVAALVDSGGLLFVVIAIALAVLGADRADALFEDLEPATPDGSRRGDPAVAELTPEDATLIDALRHAVSIDRVYRREGLTIGDLAQLLGVAEYRLRRVINQGLGHRNFSSFLNGHRIAEAKAALSDPDQAAVPILTIALDAGFNSLGPFNRAFKAATDATPSDFRRAALGQAIATSAGRSSRSAGQSALETS